MQRLLEFALRHFRDKDKPHRSDSGVLVTAASLMNGRPSAARGPWLTFLPGPFVSTDTPQHCATFTQGCYHRRWLTSIPSCRPTCNLLGKTGESSIEPTEGIYGLGGVDSLGHNGSCTETCYVLPPQTNYEEHIYSITKCQKMIY